MFSNYSEEAKKILINAKVEKNKLKHPYVGSEHFLLALLKDKNDVSKRLRQYDLNYNLFKKQVVDIVGVGSYNNDCVLYTPLLKRIMETAMIDSKENNNGVVTIKHLFSALLEEGEGIAIRILLGMGIDLDEVYKDFACRVISLKSKRDLLVEEIGVDLTKKALENAVDPVIGRDEEIKRILEILSRRKKNNPLLIGDAGVGKTAIVEELSRLIAIGDVPRNLKNKRIISVNMASTVAGTKYRGEFEERIQKMLKELEDNDDIILFIDEIHTIVGAGGAEGAIDASNIFKPALARNKMRLIGATTIEEYKKFIAEDRALERRFQKVDINEPDDKTLKNILMKLKSTYEDYHHVYIGEEKIDLIIKLSNKYIYDRKQPDKAIDILDEVCAHVSLKENKNIKKYNSLNMELKDILKRKKQAILNNDFKKATMLKEEENRVTSKINNLELKLYNKNNNNHIKEEDILNVISRKSNIPIYKFKTSSIKDIKLLTKNLKSKIYGQDEAINQLISVYKQIKLGYKDDRCTSFLFVGSSGIGKTMLAKLFAKHLSRNAIKLDMSEYSESHSISKIVGSPAGYVGYNDNKNVLEKIKNNPFSVIILDEIDKAHSSIINLFYQVLDEGVIKDSRSNIINMRNNIVIMTTNIGYEVNSIGFNNDTTNQQIKDILGIPFINRIDNVIHFNKLDKENIKNIVKDKIVRLKQKYKGLKIVISKNVINEIIDKCDYELFGARKIDKVINSYLENEILNNIISNEKSIYIKTIKEKQLN